MSKNFLVIALLFIFATTLQSSECTQKWEVIEQHHDISTIMELYGKCDDDLRAALFEMVNKNRPLSYNQARKYVFEQLFNERGVVCDVYEKHCIETESIPNSSVMNVEHTWPQSHGAVGVAKSDLHHLFPATGIANSTRGNHPFCEVDKVTRRLGSSFFGKDIYGSSCFEPQTEHKGNVARAMFYFAIRYQKSIDHNQELYFKRWTDLDPVDEKESSRNGYIEGIQDNRNPFVDYPYLISLISDI